MPCLHPVTVHGDRFACGRCIGCRIQHSQDWSIRLNYELRKWDYQALFITLTYSDEHLNYGPSGLPTVYKKDVQNYIKRVRKDLAYDNRSCKYFAVGEYGGTNQTTVYGKVVPVGRPHAHIILFGVGPNDVPMLKSNWHNDAYPRWDYGHAWGFVEPDSIQYVTGYCLKKWTGAKGREEYTAKGINPPFQLSSQYLGLDGFYEDVEQIDSQKGIMYRGKLRHVPRYFRKKMDWTGENWNWEQVAEMEAISLETQFGTFQRLRELGYKRGLNRKTNLKYQHYIEDEINNVSYAEEKRRNFENSSKENKIL